MIRITAECPRCERVELGPDDITLVVNPWEDDAWYVFDCTSCAHQVVEQAPDPVVSVLTGAHVTVSVMPAEAVERNRVRQDRPIDIDDLLDVLLWLHLGSGPDSPPRRHADRRGS